MPPKRRVAGKNTQQPRAHQQPREPYTVELATTVAVLARSSPANDGHLADVSRVEAEELMEERPAGDAVACMFAYTAGLRMMQGQTQRVDIAAARDEDGEDGAVTTSLQLEPEEEAEETALEVRQHLLSPQHAVLQAEGTEEEHAVLMATLSPRPERGSVDDPLEACGRVLEFEAPVPVVCAVIAKEEEADAEAAPERATSDHEEAKDGVEAEEPLEMQRRLAELEAQNKQLSEQRQETETLLEAIAGSPMLQAALSPELRSQLSPAADDASQGKLDERDINQLLLQVLTRSGSELSAKTDDDQASARSRRPSASPKASAAGALTPPPTSAARRRKKRPSAGAASPFRCCSAPLAEH